MVSTCSFWSHLHHIHFLHNMNFFCCKTFPCRCSFKCCIMWIVGIITLIVLLFNLGVIIFKIFEGSSSSSNDDHGFFHHILKEKNQNKAYLAALQQRTVSLLSNQSSIKNPIAIRCFSAFVNFNSEGKQSGDLIADCLDNEGGGMLLAATQCQPARRFTHQRWSLLNISKENKSGGGHHLANYDYQWVKSPAKKSEPPIFSIKPTNCLRQEPERQSFWDEEGFIFSALSFFQNQFGSPYLEFTSCTTNNSRLGSFEIKVVATETSLPPMPYGDEQKNTEPVATKKQYVFFTISSLQSPDLCFTCPRGSGQDELLPSSPSPHWVTLEMCSAESPSAAQLFYLDGLDVDYSAVVPAPAS